jgi:hypothetical protein
MNSAISVLFLAGVQQFLSAILWCVGYNVDRHYTAPERSGVRTLARSANTMDACGHGIMSTDMIPTPERSGVRILARSANTICTCAYGIMSTDMIQMYAYVCTCKECSHTGTKCQ